MNSSVISIDHMKTFALESSATVMKSSHIWLGGCQSIMHAMALDAQARFEQGWSNWSALSKAKTAYEALEIQTSQAQAAIQRSLDGSARLNNASFKLVQDMMAPINASISRTTEMAASPGD